MKSESSSIDKQSLFRLLKLEYGLEIVAFNFVPIGEESYGYIAQTLAGMQYFIKLNQNPSDLAVKYEAAHRLHMQCGLNFVVFPHKTRQGTFHADFEPYVVAVFDFIKGTISEQHGFTDEEWQQAAMLTALLHTSSPCVLLPTLPTEQFQLWFREWLLNVLDAVEDAQPRVSWCEDQARILFASEKSDILATLRDLESLLERVDAIQYEQALTHGDLKPENFIKEHNGNLHIIDWNKVAVAPPERDLVNFIGERFELFLARYVQVWERPPKLYVELFEYYVYFLKLWSVADYGSWLLLEKADLVEKQHAWQELQQCLPINHGHIRDELNTVGQVIQRLGCAAEHPLHLIRSAQE